MNLLRKQFTVPALGHPEATQIRLDDCRGKERNQFWVLLLFYVNSELSFRVSELTLYSYSLMSREFELVSAILYRFAFKTIRNTQI